MSWATRHIEALRRGETVSFRPRGRSMEPRIRSGQLCTVEPATVREVAVGDVVLCVVRGAQYLHIVTAKRAEQAQISNNHGHVNGWTAAVYGRLVRVGDGEARP